jgi:hypothetical protein
MFFLTRVYLFALLSLMSCITPVAAVQPLPQDIYVWQRVWSEPVRSALFEASDVTSGWRVLVAESDAPGRVKRIAVDWAALARTHKPVTAVIRIDGQLAINREWGLYREIVLMLRDWRKNRVALAGLEIDYDCGTARLGDYSRFLVSLRALPDAPKRISVTMLPAWLGAPELPRILDETDEVVLQVHAVRAPQEGLFDPSVARGWIDRLDGLTQKPFGVALPDYGTRIVEGDNGAILAVESEMPKLIGGAAARELVAAPADVAALLSSVKRKPPENLAGFVWFRLPTEEDSRIWSLATLKSVMRGAPLTGRVEALTRSGRVAGLRDILLTNFGDSDVPLPRRIELPPVCKLADGINGYTLGAPGKPIVLERLQSALLRAHHAELVGWMRCAQGDLSIHVAP